MEQFPAGDRLWLLLREEIVPAATLHGLACDFAEATLHIYEERYPGDSRPRDAIASKRAWLRGEATDEALAAALAAAVTAALDAALDVDAARIAAGVAAGAAARDSAAAAAARAEARAAAGAVAGAAAAQVAARVAARTAQLNLVVAALGRSHR
jgi:hypothetical protein